MATKKRRNSVRLRPDEAMQVSRIALGADKLVYAIVASKRLKYPNGRSRIAYIGTTKKGISRIASSVAERSDSVLNLHGVKSFTVRVLTCKPRQKVRTWFKLEHALLWVFKEHFGEVPKCNSPKRTKTAGDVFKYFSKAGLLTKIEDIS